MINSLATDITFRFNLNIMSSVPPVIIPVQFTVNFKGIMVTNKKTTVSFSFFTFQKNWIKIFAQIRSLRPPDTDSAMTGEMIVSPDTDIGVKIKKTIPQVFRRNLIVTHQRQIRGIQFPGILEICNRSPLTPLSRQNQRIVFPVHMNTGNAPQSGKPDSKEHPCSI